MTKIIPYEKLLENKDDIRDRFIRIMYADPKPIHVIARDIPMAAATLRRFVKEGRIATKYILFKIYSFVLKKEKVLGE